MLKFLPRMILLSAALFVLAAPARAHEVWFAHPLQSYELGEPSYWPGTHNWEPGIASGCWKWNWQQRSWYDRCPTYVHPKAFMYRYGTPRVVVRKY